MPESLLDTDTLSGIMRQNPVALHHAQAYLSVYSQFTISAMTRYEILRGLKAKNATTQLLAFDLSSAD
jgi:tRNA(fMet)-specific endonuclease VapC